MEKDVMHPNYQNNMWLVPVINLGYKVQVKTTCFIPAADLNPLVY